MPTFPLPKHADGRKANVSDGFHSAADLAAGRSKRVHRGNDIMFWIPRLNSRRGKVDFPYSTGNYEIPRPASLGGYDCPVVATETSKVVAAGKLRTGWWVALQLSGARAVAYHHLSSILVAPGAFVEEGTPLGFVGGSPVGHGLWHLHFDYTEARQDPDVLKTRGRLMGTFIDPAPYLAKCKHITLEEAWGDLGRVA